MNFVAQFEIELTEPELNKIAKIAKDLSKDFGDVVRMCMNEGADDMLKTFAQAPVDIHKPISED